MTRTERLTKVNGVHAGVDEKAEPFEAADEDQDMEELEDKHPAPVPYNTDEYAAAVRSARLNQRREAKLAASPVRGRSPTQRSREATVGMGSWKAPTRRRSQEPIRNRCLNASHMSGKARGKS
ncbi:unnamed protein product [Phytophthora fragariaefolia]|uniref:Unnamed protein product n=1 Tax=Phytophthora fragariaefolia TaxID=1490495 RepID=A0A9W6X798_9STRA|nr:unnamed protein product [Phytophthora fragariaefolia]